MFGIVLKLLVHCVVSCLLTWNRQCLFDFERPKKKTVNHRSSIKIRWRVDRTNYDPANLGKAQMYLKRKFRFQFLKVIGYCFLTCSCLVVWLILLEWWKGVFYLHIHERTLEDIFGPLEISPKRIYQELIMSQLRRCLQK